MNQIVIDNIEIIVTGIFLLIAFVYGQTKKIVDLRFSNMRGRFDSAREVLELKIKEHGQSIVLLEKRYSGIQDDVCKIRECLAVMRSKIDNIEKNVCKK